MREGASAREHRTLPLPCIERLDSHGSRTRTARRRSWVEGRREGVGKEICGNGDVYQGRFENDQHVSLSLLKKEHMLAGLDENGVRIRIFTAKLTGTRAAFVTPGHTPGLSESTYTGDTLPDPYGRKGLTVPGRLRHGHGEIKYASGSHFVGQWAKDKRAGRGTYTYACGDTYEGEWLDGMYHGKGSYVGKGSDSYEGEWKCDQMDGFGKYTYSISGDTYEGEWRRGLFHGKGKYTAANGEVYEGMHDTGERVNK